jgi:hypothetical protein
VPRAAPRLGPRGARPAAEITADADDDEARAEDDDSDAKPKPRPRRKAIVEDEGREEVQLEEEREQRRSLFGGRPGAVERREQRSDGGGPTVRASSEVSAYTDTDAVHVLSPTVAGAVTDELAGWSIGGSYLVDAVSAASVDIVSTASSHWVERRHVGAGSASFKAGPVGVALSGGFSREPDYLSLGGGGVISSSCSKRT